MPACFGQEENTPAGCSKSSSSKAVASEGPRRYTPHFLWAVCPCKGSWRTEKPLQRFRPRESPSYVEGLNDARPLHGRRRVLARLGRADEKNDFFSILLFWHEDQHPGRAFFDHVRKTSSGTAGGDSWQDSSTANLNGPETIGRALRREKGKHSWNLPA